MVEAALFQRANEGTRALLVAELEDFFASLDLSKPEAARDSLLVAVPQFVDDFGSSASAVAMDFYDEARFEAGATTRFRAVEGVNPYLTAVEPMVRRAAGALWTEAPEATLQTLTASAPKYALAAPRETILENANRDPEADGWRRETRGATCEFCKALAARGGVYREATASFAAHAHCDCAAVPNFDTSLPAVPAAAYKLSARTTKMSPAQRALHRKRTSEWIASLS